MEAAERQGNLEALAQLLQDCLQTDTASPMVMRIRCALRQETLMILGQHSPETKPESQVVFSIFENAIRSLQLEFAQDVQLYLRVAGSPQPYSFYGFSLKLAGGSQQVEMSAMGTVRVQGAETLETSFRPSVNRDSASDFPNPIMSQSVPASAEAAVALGEVEVLSNPLTSSGIGLDEPELETDNRFESASRSQITKSWPSWDISPVKLMVGAGAIAVLSLLSGGVYGMTRPCVLGACPQIQQAQQLSQRSQQRLQGANSQAALADSRQHLETAIQLLTRVPTWSHHQGTIHALLTDYQGRAAAFDRLLAAMEQAQEAAEKSQKPPHPVSTWQTIQGLWQGAIVHLESIPLDSELYGLAKQKLQQYRTNLVAIDQRVLMERRSEETLRTAQAAAQAAIARAKTAHSVEEWRRVHSTWTTAMRALEQIPQGTLAYQSRKQLKKQYQSELTAVRDRTIQEELAAKMYRQANTLAQQAENLEKKNQWSQATDTWQKALSHAKQVPKKTLYYNQAQQLVTSLTRSLEAAAIKSSVNGHLQKARTDLDRVCSDTTTVCSYAISNTLIKIRLTQEYEQTVAQALNSPAVSGVYSGAYNVQLQARDHVRAVLQALAIISDNANLPLAVYNADGSQFGYHLPGIPGYQQHSN